MSMNCFLMKSMRAMCAPKAKEGVEKSGHHSNGGFGRIGFFQRRNVN